MTRRSLARLRGCERGAAAVEFALIAPFLILFHFGAVELVQAWEANRRVSHIAAALGDLTAQKRSVTSAEMNDILRAGDLLIQPFASDRLSQRITSFYADAGGKVEPDWTVTRNWTASGSPSLPNGLLQANESVIAVEVTYSHRALFGLVLGDAVTMRKKAYVRPRLSKTVAMG